jgi:hypothetical protein
MTNSQSTLSIFHMFRSGFGRKGAGKIESYFGADAKAPLLKATW